MTIRGVIIGLALAALALAALGCGPKKGPTIKERALADVGEDIDPVSHLVGDVAPVEEEGVKSETPTESGEAPQTESDGDVIGGPQGAFFATLTVFGKEEAGTIRVLTATDNPQIVQENLPTGKDIMLDPGLYDIEFQTDVVAGGGKKTLQGVEIVAGRRIKREIKYPVGRLTLVTGGRCVKAAIRIKEKGADNWLPGKYFTCQEIILPAGWYEAERGSTPISGIQVYDGGIQQVLIRPK